ncbi:MAG TPA: hypothetical protein VLK82_02600 [Candidatus Tectomicrobia bacterium]|nr:hypothetical protein [Candidatus Tectomicrobia bacterium]
MPIDILDRKLSEELCLGSSSAFANDNARPDCCWLRAIAHAVAEPEAMAVTHLVAQAELEIMAQIHFEYGYGMNRRLRCGRLWRCHLWGRRAQR